jgi:hypothetical protein
VQGEGLEGDAGEVVGLKEAEAGEGVGGVEGGGEVDVGEVGV